jgi:hypothetical protein
MNSVFICDAIRTPIGRYGGALAGVRTDDLAVIPIKALMERNPSVDWAAVDDVVLGCANQAGEDNRNVARMALLLAGLPETVPGSTVIRKTTAPQPVTAALAIDGIIIPPILPLVPRTSFTSVRTTHFARDMRCGTGFERQSWCQIENLGEAVSDWHKTYKKPLSCQSFVWRRTRPAVYPLDLLYKGSNAPIVRS